MVKKLNYSYIYYLIDPETNEIRYVGQTSDISTRLYQHLNSKNNSLKDAWILKLKSKNLVPILKEVEYIPSFFASARESFHITELLLKGTNLFNKRLTHSFKTAMHHFEINLELKGLVMMDARNSDYFHHELINDIIFQYYNEKIGYKSGDDINKYKDVKTFAKDKRSKCKICNCIVDSPIVANVYYCELHGPSL